MTTITENPQIVEHKHRWGKYLLRMAWVIEILAALLGIAIAWIMGYQTYEIYTTEFGEFPLSRYFDLILAGLPFVMVAAVEILKIPLCFVVYINTGFRIRLIFTIVLIAITFITFETLATGFERQFHNISTNVEIPQDKLVALTKKIQFTRDQIKGKEIVSDESIKEEVEFRTQAAKDSLEEAVDNMKVQIKQYLDLGGGTLAEQKEQKELELDRLIVERTEQIAKIEKEGTARRDSKQNDIDKIKEQRDIDVANAKEFSSSERDRVAREIKAIDDALEVTINNKKEYFVPAIEADNKNQTAKIIAINERIEQLRESIKAIRAEKDVVVEDPTFMEVILQRKGQLNQQIEEKETEIDGLLSQISDLELTSEIALNAAIQKLITQADADKKKIRDEAFGSDVGDIQKILNDAKAEIKILEDEISKSTNDEIESIAQIETNFDQTRKMIYEDLDEIVRQQSLTTQYTKEIARLETQIAARRAEYTDEIKEIDKYRQTQVNKLSQNEAKKDELLVMLNNLEEEELGLRLQIEKAYQDTQIYRFAKTFFNIKDGQIVEEEQINFIAKIWFGSLALIVATMGTFLAFGAFILKYSGQEFKDFRSGGGSGPIGRAFRKTLASRRKKYNAPKIKEVEVEKIVEVEKEVIKEVEVEKIVKVDKEVLVEVNKIVEVPVPVDVVKKEVVHYPIFTNDPDYLRFSKTKFSDLVVDKKEKKKKKKDDE